MLPTAKGPVSGSAVSARQPPRHQPGPDQYGRRRSRHQAHQGDAARARQGPPDRSRRAVIITGLSRGGSVVASRRYGGRGARRGCSGRRGAGHHVVTGGVIVKTPRYAPVVSTGIVVEASLASAIIPS